MPDENDKLPEGYDKTNPNIAKNEDGSPKVTVSEPKLNPEDGKFHVQRDEWRENIYEEGDDKYTEPEKVEGVVYVSDTTSQTVQFDEEVVVEIEGEETVSQTNITNEESDIKATDVDDSNSIIATDDGSTRYYADKTNIVFDEKTGGNYAANKENWKNTLNNRYDKKYKGVWGNAITKGASTGVGYAIGQSASFSVMSLFSSLTEVEQVIDITFHYKTSRTDVITAKYSPTKKSVMEVHGLTLANLGVTQDSKEHSSVLSDITIFKKVKKEDLKSKGIGLDMQSMASGKETGSLYQFFNMFFEKEDMEYALYVEIQIYEKALILNKEIGHYDLRKARIKQYEMRGFGPGQEPMEILQLSGYLRELKVVEQQDGVIGKIKQFGRGLTGGWKSKKVEDGFAPS